MVQKNFCLVMNSVRADSKYKSIMIQNVFVILVYPTKACCIKFYKYIYLLYTLCNRKPVIIHIFVALYYSVICSHGLAKTQNFKLVHYVKVKFFISKSTFLFVNDLSSKTLNLESQYFQV